MFLLFATLYSANNIAARFPLRAKETILRDALLREIPPSVFALESGGHMSHADASGPLADVTRFLSARLGRSPFQRAATALIKSPAFASAAAIGALTVPFLAVGGVAVAQQDENVIEPCANATVGNATQCSEQLFPKVRGCGGPLHVR